MKTCSRCKEVKPDESFHKGSKGDILDSHCWHCRRQVNTESRNRYPHRWHAEQMLKPHRKGDPATFAYLTAKHIEEYLGRRIQRWEQTQGIEAHPALTTIKQLAADLCSQLDKVEVASLNVLGPRRCELCGTIFQAASSNQKFCTPAHAAKAKEQRRIANGYYIRKGQPKRVATALKRRIRQGIARARALEPQIQQHCHDLRIIRDHPTILTLRAQGWDWENIATHLGYTSGGSLAGSLHYRGLYPKGLGNKQGHKARP